MKLQIFVGAAQGATQKTNVWNHGSLNALLALMPENMIESNSALLSKISN